MTVPAQRHLRRATAEKREKDLFRQGVIDMQARLKQQREEHADPLPPVEVASTSTHDSLKKIPQTNASEDHLNNCIVYKE